MKTKRNPPPLPEKLRKQMVFMIQQHVIYGTPLPTGPEEIDRWIIAAMKTEKTKIPKNGN